MSKISVIIPAFNEEKTIKDTIDAVQSTQLVDEIIVVDDGSKDHTVDIAKQCGAKTIRCHFNMGKGKALERGIKECEGDIIVFLDADVGHTGSEITKIIQPIKQGQCDVAIAKFGRSGKKGGFGLVKFVSRYGVKLLSGRYIESVLSGQRAFKAEVLKNISMGSGYGAEASMTIDIIRRGYKIGEFEVNMIHHETGRDLKGFLHRGKQMRDILVVLLIKLFKQGRSCSRYSNPSKGR